MYDVASNSFIYTCQNAGCDYKKSELHTEHNYVVSGYNDDNETLSCSICGNNQVREHNLGSPIQGSASCETIYNCTNDGCGPSRSNFVHAYKPGLAISYNGTNDDYCYKVPYTCLGCGDSYEENVPHTIYSNSNKFGTKITCTNSNCNYSKFIPPEANAIDEVATLTRKKKN